MRWLTNFYDFSFKWTATAAVGIHPTKAWLSQLVNFKNAIWTRGRFRRTICNKIVLNLEKNATETYGMLQTAFRPSCMKRASVFEWHKRFKEGRESVNNDERCGRSQEFDWPKLGLSLGLIKRVQEEIRSEEASSLQIVSVAFTPGQCTSPQLHSCHRLFDQDGYQDSSSASL